LDINVVGRHVDVSDRFRRHLDDKLEKVGQLAPRALRVEVEVSHENNPRQSDLAERVELTVYDSGQVIRSEARADDLYAALDVAYGKLLERLRRSRDRAKSKKRATVRGAAPDVVEPLPGSLVDEIRNGGASAAAEDEGEDLGESPVVIREKVHETRPMTIDEALYEMELVGHDFYLFEDSDSGTAKVVYRRRRGWNYGIIELQVDRGPRPTDEAEG
jgi:ribosomal subunit interface protein